MRVRPPSVDSRSNRVSKQVSFRAAASRCLSGIGGDDVELHVVGSALPQGLACPAVLPRSHPALTNSNAATSHTPSRLTAVLPAWTKDRERNAARRPGCHGWRGRLSWQRTPYEFSWQRRGRRELARPHPGKPP